MTYKPHDALREGFPWVPVIFIALLVISGGLALVTWLTQSLWFAVDNANVNHQIHVSQVQASASASIYQANPGVQLSWIQAGETDVQAASQAQTGPNATADGQQACADFSHVTILGTGDKMWYEHNCSGPALSRSSIYFPKQ
jgi:hypothetical protein